MIPEQEASVKGVGLDNFRPLVKRPGLDGPPEAHPTPPLSTGALPAGAFCSDSACW